MILIGDLHGSVSMLAYRINKGGLSKKSIIQVGDFGLGYLPKEAEIHNLMVIDGYLREADSYLYIVRGNHDNPKYWYEYNFPLTNIYLVKDYTVIKIEDKNILFIGGGISIDKIDRIEDVDYWKDEVVRYTNEDIFSVRTQLESIQETTIDIIVSHIAPSFVFPLQFNNIVEYYIKRDPSLKQKLLEERKIMDKVFEIFRPAKWYYGHYHKNMDTNVLGTEFKCLGIMSIWDTNKNDYIFTEFDVMR